MTELEQALVALGGELDIPPAPELTSRVRARIERRSRWRRGTVKSRLSRALDRLREEVGDVRA